MEDKNLTWVWAVIGMKKLILPLIPHGLGKQVVLVLSWKMLSWREISEYEEDSRRNASIAPPFPELRCSEPGASPDPQKKRGEPSLSQHPSPNWAYQRIWSQSKWILIMPSLISFSFVGATAYKVLASEFIDFYFWCALFIIFSFIF